MMRPGRLQCLIHSSHSSEKGNPTMSTALALSLSPTIFVAAGPHSEVFILVYRWYAMKLSFIMSR